ncbi:MAG TPA: PAS domain S-box protein [Burkholderiales bacterium]|nr:PAS domain S-box protein [Burkholderiales bacterium]
MEDALFRMLVEQTKDYALFVLDPEGRVMTWNPGAQRIKQYAASEIIGRHFSDFYPREAIERGWPQHELKLAAAEGRFEDEGWRVRKDGSRFWASVVITALRGEDGKLLGFSKITRDLTDRKLHEEALRQSEERFRLLVDGVVDYAVYMLDAEGIVSSWNVGAERIKGYRRDEIIGKHFSRFYTADEREAGRPWEELTLARRNGRAEDEGWRVRKDGSRFWARVVVTALHDAEGQLRGFAKVTQDLTQQRELRNLQRAAQQVNEFVAMLAHELRNPLAPIRSAVQVLQKLPPGDPSVPAMYKTLERQSGQLARIVDDMIDISRITRGVLEIRKQPMELAEALHAALESAAPEVQARRHTIEVDVPRGGLQVSGDLHRLTQVLTNLLNNAARYTPEGGRITVKAAAEAGSAVLRVIDNGRGISPELLPRIFDMFVQGRTALERVGGGLGIGLALARRIAEMHDGRLEALSAGDGRGAEFVLRLPLCEAASEAATPAREPAVGKRHAAMRVLIVDDNNDAAAALELLLRSLGHETRVAHDGAAALATAGEFAPDLVLLDIGMPGLDGYEVARRLRALGGRRFRLVALTGWGQEADRKRSEEAGFDQHLVKPLDVEELSRALAPPEAGDDRNGATLH